MLGSELVILIREINSYPDPAKFRNADPLNTALLLYILTPLKNSRDVREKIEAVENTEEKEAVDNREEMERVDNSEEIYQTVDNRDRIEAVDNREEI